MLPNPYGTPIGVEEAKKLAAVALAEARKNNWKMAVAIVDPNGDLIYFEKMDHTQIGSSQIAIAKARSSARFKAPHQGI
jgi:glc operon protein GlcG